MNDGWKWRLWTAEYDPLKCIASIRQSSSRHLNTLQPTRSFSLVRGKNLCLPSDQKNEDPRERHNSMCARILQFFERIVKQIILFPLTFSLVYKGYSSIKQWCFRVVFKSFPRPWNTLRNYICSSVKRDTPSTLFLCKAPHVCCVLPWCQPCHAY